MAEQMMKYIEEIADATTVKNVYSVETETSVFNSPPASPVSPSLIHEKPSMDITIKKRKKPVLKVSDLLSSPETSPASPEVIVDKGIHLKPSAGGMKRKLTPTLIPLDLSTTLNVGEIDPQIDPQIDCGYNSEGFNYGKNSDKIISLDQNKIPKIGVKKSLLKKKPSVIDPLFTAHHASIYDETSSSQLIIKNKLCLGNPVNRLIPESKEYCRFPLGNGTFLIVCDFKNEYYVHIREFDHHGKATKKGVTLLLCQAAHLKIGFSMIHDIFKKVIKGKNVNVHYRHHLGRNTFLTLKQYNLYCDIRHFWRPIENNPKNQLKPTQKGISLNGDEFTALGKALKRMSDYLPILNTIKPCWLTHEPHDTNCEVCYPDGLAPDLHIFSGE